MIETNKEQTVSASPSTFGSRGTKPAPKRKLNSSTILIFTGIFSILSLGVLFLAFSGEVRPVKQLISTKRDALPSDAVTGLPGDYEELARRRPKGKSDLQLEAPIQIAKQEMSAAEKLRLEMLLAKLKRAQDARVSDVSFKQIRIDSNRTGQAASDSPLAQMKGNSEESTAASLNPRDFDSRQDEKREFLERARLDPTTLRQAIKSPLSPYQVMAGAIVPGVLLTGVNSDLPGQVMGQVSQGVYDSVNGAHLLIPQGTKILGTYDSRVVYGQERVLVVWTRLIMPNGNSINLEGMPGVDLSGYAGLSDVVNNHYVKLLTGVVLGSILGAGAQIAEGGNSTSDQSFSQLAAQGAAKNINDAGQQITRKNLSISPTLEITPGYRFNVFVTKDMVLEPYEE